MPVRSRGVARRRASAGTHGVDPIAPAISATSRSGVTYHLTVYIVGSERPRPAIAFRKAAAPVSVSARKNTQPIITTSMLYTWDQIGQDRMPGSLRVADC